jgi:hypothetical protein
LKEQCTTTHPEPLMARFLPHPNRSLRSGSRDPRHIGQLRQLGYRASIADGRLTFSNTEQPV